MLTRTSKELAKRETDTVMDGWVGCEACGFCRIIDFASKDDMKRALRKLEGSELNGKRIRLQFEVNRAS